MVGRNRPLFVLFGSSIIHAVLVPPSAPIESARPPKQRMLLLPWLVGGFLMSMTWAYITAHELLALLVSLGRILGVSPSVLGLTVLAWGNSVGDLVANVAMAVKGGRRGAQVVISGCYAGGHLRVLISLPRKGSVVVYLPRGHLEQVAGACGVGAADGGLARHDVPPHVFCPVVDVKLHAETSTYEVSLMPEDEEPLFLNICRWFWLFSSLWSLSAYCAMIELELLSFDG